MLTIFDNFDHFQQSWQFLTIFDNINFCWQFWQILTILTIFTTCYNFGNFLTIFTIQTIAFAILTIESTILETCDIWDTEFMTIFVTWPLIVTLDSIRNSCYVLLYLALVGRTDWHIHWPPKKEKFYCWTGRKSVLLNWDDKRIAVVTSALPPPLYCTSVLQHNIESSKVWNYQTRENRKQKKE